MKNISIVLQLMSGAGNRFTVFDNRISQISNHIISSLAPKLCHAPFADGLPTEGVIALHYGDGMSEFEATFFNPDGSHGVMCGNGGRCAVAYSRKISSIATDKNIRFTMAGTQYSANILDSDISLIFPPALEISENIEIFVHNSPIHVFYANVGSDHVVCFYEDLEKFFQSNNNDFSSLNIIEFAKPIRWHQQFAPRGVNVNIVDARTSDDGSYSIRTFERGVEAETGACGTGAIAAALALITKKRAISPIILTPTSKKKLTIQLKNNDINGRIELIGNAEFADTLQADVYNDTIIFE